MLELSVRLGFKEIKKVNSNRSFSLQESLVKVKKSAKLLAWLLLECLKEAIWSRSHWRQFSTCLKWLLLDIYFKNGFSGVNGVNGFVGFF